MWKQLSSKKIFDHPRVGLVEDEVLLPDGTKANYLTFENRNDSVTVICEDASGRILIQKEYSYPIDAVLYQFPGGKAEPDEPIEQSARRELKEEAGYDPKELQYLGWYYVNNRRTASKMHVFFATELAECEKSGGDHEEDISSEWMTAEEIEQLIANNQIPNFSVLAAWALFKNRATVAA